MSSINRIEVDSQMVREVGYTYQYLEVKYRRSWKIERFYQVPIAVYQELMDSESIGKYLNSKIKPFYKSQIINSYTQSDT